MIKAFGGRARVILRAMTAAAVAVMGLAQGVWASTAAEIASYINTTTSSDLSAVVSGSTVTVTGTLSATPSGANYLTLNLDADVIVAWKASLHGSPSDTYALIVISGGAGTFDVQSGDIWNTGTGRTIINNSPNAVVNVSGGEVKASTRTTIYNYSSGTVNISGGTVSTLTGTAIVNNNSNSVVNVSGGTVSATTGTAIHIYYGTLTVSGSAIITSSTSNQTIYSEYSSAKINITGGIVENTADNGVAVYNYGTINISGGTVSSTGGNTNAINTRSGTVNISGGTVSTSGTYPAVYVYGGTAKITGGTISASHNAISTTNSPTLILGGSPTITGRIYAYPEKFSVITTDADIFAPASKVYTLDFPDAQYTAGTIAVMNGRNFVNNFILYKSNYALEAAGQHLTVAAALAKVSFDLNGGDGVPPNAIGLGSGAKLYGKPATDEFTRAGYTNDGEWYTDAAGTTKFVFGANGTVVTSNVTLYLKWTPTISVLTFDRTIPSTPGTEVAVVSPANQSSGEFAAGPNPAASQSGAVNLFRQGKRVESAELAVYDVSGNVVRKIAVSDDGLGGQARRQVGSWDLRDGRGRPVSAGTYLIRGTVATRDGGKERVSLVVGVR